MSNKTPHFHEILIIGTGFSGICMAIRLQERGFSDFVMLEKATGPGGTWRDNIYPGAACDVPSALYSYSFEHNSSWRYKWSRQDQILGYQEGIVDQYGLRPHMRFDHAVEQAVWDDHSHTWTITCHNGEQYRCRWFIPAVGQLHHPSIPDIDGKDMFTGPQFHTARWNRDFNPTGKNIAVIGNAASAVQLVPELVKTAKNVTVFQRSANWILPKLDRPYMPWEQELSAKYPVLAKAYRTRIWLLSELFLYQVMRRSRWAVWVATKLANWWRNKSIKKPALRDSQVPDYPVGAKRILFTDDWYAALQAPNCDLVTTGIGQIDETGVIDTDGRKTEADALVWATGFHTNPFMQDMQITGRNGMDLQEHWKDGATAWMGMMTRHFPNMFMLYGPNTNLGHTSILLMSEAQSDWILRCLTEARHHRWQQAEIAEKAEQDFDLEMQSRLQTTVWNEVKDSWYQIKGRITNNWPGSTREYMRRCKAADCTILETTKS